MQKEKIERANKIIGTIRSNEISVKLLEKFSESGGTLYKTEGLHTIYIANCDRIQFEPWEIRLIIHNKKQRIAALERELEEL